MLEKLPKQDLAKNANAQVFLLSVHVRCLLRADRSKKSLFRIPGGRRMIKTLRNEILNLSKILTNNSEQGVSRFGGSFCNL